MPFTLRSACLLLASLLLLGCNSCRKEQASGTANTETSGNPVNPADLAARPVSDLSGIKDTVRYPGFPESFETGHKGSYAASPLTLPSGSWMLEDALIGSLSADARQGDRSVRIKDQGSLSLQTALSRSAGRVRILHGSYGSDPAASWGLWYSTDQGRSWQQAGTEVTTASTQLTEAVFELFISKPLLLSIRKSSGGRLNIDHISVSGMPGPHTALPAENVPTRDDNLALGNPSQAGQGDPDNYLLIKPQYALGYSHSRGQALWVSWHLSTAWKGSASRCNCFAADNQLPASMPKVLSTHYTGSGFDRGHLCPSDDRDGSAADNEATFLMINMAPQAPALNQQSWQQLEAYCRALIQHGQELYILAGSYGTGGSGNAGARTSIGSGAVTVPARFWKVIVVLPTGNNDVTRVSTQSRIIAVDMPNDQSAGNNGWGYYRTSVDAIEAATGLDLLSNLPAPVQQAVEARTDQGPVQ
jgi:endonuclease G